ncbi:MAG: class I SAM-dependent methyltransferase [Chloroflexi bacterium]|nr:class I SAM-dependent methyltransferase [Chloroflexota bacterium]
MQLRYLLRRSPEGLTPEGRYQWKTTRATLKQYPKDIRFRREQAKQGGMPPMPSPYLRYRVSGNYHIQLFHESGRGSRNDFENALKGVGKSFNDFHSILDFGAGCSRIMRWMQDLSQHAELYGTDIDAKAIRWSKRHIPFAKFGVNQGLPPLNYPDGKFDLVYSHSVFTHLNEEYQDAWLAELKRVTKPGAVLLLTVHGDNAWQGFYESGKEHPGMAEHVASYEKNGCHFVHDDEWTGVFPDFYHSMFHQKRYIMEHWAKYFTILNYLEQGMLNYQDMVVLQRD